MTLRNFESDLTVSLGAIDEYLGNITSDVEGYVDDFTVRGVLSLLNDIRSELILMGREQR